MNAFLRRTPVAASALLVALLLAAAWGQGLVDDPDEGFPIDLRPPTSTTFANPAWYDLIAIRWPGHGAPTGWLEIELGAVDPGGPGPLGLRQPIVEVYVDDGAGGAIALLPGSGLRMPPDGGWRYAVRVTGEGAWLWTVDPDDESVAGPQTLPALIDGRSVWVSWPGPWPEEATVYAISGVHDPFSPSGWRPFATASSPWAFASDEPGPPVVDVLPGDAETWREVRASGALQRPGAGGAGVGNGHLRWWALMGAGLALALAGLWWRSRPPVSQRPASLDEATGAAVVEGVPPGPSSDATLIGEEDVEPPAVAPEKDEAAQAQDGAVVQESETGLDAEAAQEDDEGPSRPVEAEPARRTEADDASPTGATTDDPSPDEAADPPVEGEDASRADPAARSSERDTKAPNDASRSEKRS